MRKALYRPEHSSTVAQKGIADSNTLDLSCCGANAKAIVVIYMYYLLAEVNFGLIVS